LLGRLEGYKRALAKNNIPFDSDLVMSTDRAEELGDAAAYSATQILLGQNPRPDGIFCYNDLAAYGAITAILDAGLRVPEDVSYWLRQSSLQQIPPRPAHQRGSAKRCHRPTSRQARSPAHRGRPARCAQAHYLEPRLVVRASTRKQKAPRPQLNQLS